MNLSSKSKHTINGILYSYILCHFQNVFTGIILFNAPNHPLIQVERLLGKEEFESKPVSSF